MAPNPKPASPSPAAAGESLETIPTRESLLSRLKDWEDGESWQEFFSTYWRLIYNMARKANLSDAEAQDIVQETVLSVARKIEGFRYDPSVCSFKSWMLQITRWRILNQLKKRQREHNWVQTGANSEDATRALEQVPDPMGFDLDAIWDAEWQKNLYTAALDRVRRRIDPEHFQIFDLCCIDQWPVAKVTATLGVSSARVYLVKHRVSRLLQNEIARLQKLRP